MYHDHLFSLRNMTTERALGVGVGGDREVGRGVDKIWTGRGVGNIEGLHKITGLAPLSQLYKKTLKISHPPIIETTPPIPVLPISSKHFPSPPPLQPFFKTFILSVSSVSSFPYIKAVQELCWFLNKNKIRIKFKLVFQWNKARWAIL